jgi:hypothetical protein
MSDPYTIRMYVPNGDSDGVKIAELHNWSGVGVAFPRRDWPTVNTRPEFTRSGVYILSGVSENAEDELKKIYVGQGESVGSRIGSHDINRDFWDWGYAFVSKGEPLNRAHTTWLEYALLERARRAKRCDLDNQTQPREPRLSESDLADVRGFLREILRILPLLNVHVFDDAIPIVVRDLHAMPPYTNEDSRDTIVVPARDGGFARVFLGENSWYAIRIAGGMLPKIKYIAAYRSAPVSAITSFAGVERIEPYGNEGKYRIVFSGAAKNLVNPVPFGDAASGSMQGPRYTSLSKLLAAKKISELFD